VGERRGGEEDRIGREGRVGGTCRIRRGSRRVCSRLWRGAQFGRFRAETERSEASRESGLARLVFNVNERNQRDKEEGKREREEKGSTHPSDESTTLDDSFTSHENDVHSIHDVGDC